MADVGADEGAATDPAGAAEPTGAAEPAGDGAPDVHADPAGTAQVGSADQDEPGTADPGPITVAIEQIDTDPALIAEVRSDPTLQGATDTAFLYLVAWLHGINTGDATLLAELATPGCRYCAATVDRLATDPRTTADGFTTTMTGTLLGADGPDANHSYAVVGIGVRVDSVYVTESGGVPAMQMLEPQTVAFRFAVENTESGWTIRGIANEEWTGPA